MMNLNTDDFDRWLCRYSQASRENDARASAELFALEARYYESPFDEPLVGREAIYRYWERGARILTDKESNYEIIAVRENLGIARWQSQFTQIESGSRFHLDCLFLVEFDEDLKCQLFREWWHGQVI